MSYTLLKITKLSISAFQIQKKVVNLQPNLKRNQLKQ